MDKWRNIVLIIDYDNILSRLDTLRKANIILGLNTLYTFKKYL